MEILNELTDELLNVLLENSRQTYQKDLTEFTHGELSILKYLRDEGSGLPAGEFSKSLGMTLPRMSAAISGLVKKGLVSKLTDSVDRRKIRIHITHEGINYVNRTEDALRGQIADIVARLGQDETEEYMRILEKIRRIHPA